MDPDRNVKPHRYYFKRRPWMEPGDLEMLNQLAVDRGIGPAKEMYNLIHQQARSDQRWRERWPPMDAEQREAATGWREAAPYQAGGGRARRHWDGFDPYARK